MCLAIPAKIIKIENGQQTAIVDAGGIQKSISLALVENIGIGDYVLVHVGFALNKIDPTQAERTLELFASAGVIKELS